MVTNSHDSLIFIGSIKGTLYEFTGVVQAYSYTRDFTKNLLTRKEEAGGLNDLKAELEFISIDSHFDSNKVSSKIFHLFYELGPALEKRLAIERHDSDILGIFLEFSSKKLFKPLMGIQNIDVRGIEGPSRQEYEETFARGLAHIKRGDCYQYNLTYPFKIHFSKTSLRDFVSHCWSKKSSVGKFSSVTKLPGSDQAFFSNSPECLFNIRKTEGRLMLESLPIKGTQDLGERTADEAWELLASSEKDESELFMITDLMRNDLSKLTGKWAKVIARKERMVVPGLVHSYSHLQSELPDGKTLLDVVECLFPGGSITGAPKLRVMEIISDLEKVPRGFYCGSTIILSSDNLSASINIRSGSLDCENGLMEYHSGGGITFSSDLALEYQEMLDKVQSFSRVVDARH